MASVAKTDKRSPLALPRIQRRRRYRPHRVAPYLFLLPFGALFLLFFLLPIGYALVQSLFHLHRDGLGLTPPTEEFAGLANFGQALTDATLLDGVKRVLIYGALYVPIMLVAALGLAMLLDSPAIRFRNVFRLAIVVPYAIPSVIAALLWGFLYTPSVSPILGGLRAVQVNVDPLSPQAVLGGLANIGVWEWTGYNMIIIYAQLKSISPDIYDAARIDGCSELAIARHIKIPLVAPALVLTGIFAIIATLQLFNEPRILGTFALSIASNFTPNLYTYQTAFSSSNYDYAATLAFVLALVTFVFSFGFLRVVRRFSSV